MFNQQVVSTPPAVGSAPIAMPLRILLALAPRQTPGPTSSFNALAAWNQVLGHFGWVRAMRIMKPVVWAPEWNDTKFAGLVRDAGIDALHATELRTNDFLTTAFSRQSAPPAEFHVVHYVGEVFGPLNGEPFLLLSRTPDEARGLTPTLGARDLRDALARSNTRLLILQVSTTHGAALSLAHLVAEGGGPAVLVVSGSDSDALRAYAGDVYAGLVHNQMLSVIAPPRNQMPTAPEVTLFWSPERDAALRFDGYMDELSQRIAEAPKVMGAWADQLESESALADGYLHHDDAERIRREINTMRDRATSAALDANILASVRHAPWHHETEGAVPVSEVGERVESYADTPQYDALSQELKDAKTRPPRVLNANFRLAGGDEVLGPHSPLVAGQSYDLLVDVGPRISSIVAGNAGFPEQALPPTGEGNVVKVVVMSSDFTPRTITGEIWIPTGSGRSSPMVGGKHSDPGPLALRFTMSQRYAASPATVSGRLSLYYRNNLLQSAAISAGVRRTGESLQVPNSIEVDYATSGTFRDLERLGARQVSFPGESAQAEHPVGLHVTLNGNGDGTHRVIVSGNAASEPAWLPYDPAGATQILTEVREQLLACFHLRDESGLPSGAIGLGKDNGKSREQFTRDLYMLAKIGRRLYKRVFAEVRPENDAVTAVNWEKTLGGALAESQLIQIARTESAQYTFPWSLLYSHPLSVEPYHFCTIVKEEWSPEGVRNRPPEKRCPYAGDADHKENVICPYGFWGMKHIIEQPLSAFDRKLKRPRDVESRIEAKGSFALGAGWTTDSGLDPVKLSDHKNRLLAMEGIRFGDPQPNPAHDLDTVRAVLGSSALVYFLCHGEYDDGRHEVYLGVGPNDKKAEHRIYPSSIDDWALEETLADWDKSRPLIFINGCHTVDLIPGQILNFVTAFEKARASGVIGTEVSILLPLATEVAETIIERLVAGGPAGKAGRVLFDLRWKLANKGNLLGLAYSLYAMADLHLVKSA